MVTITLNNSDIAEEKQTSLRHVSCQILADEKKGHSDRVPPSVTPGLHRAVKSTSTFGLHYTAGSFPTHSIKMSNISHDIKYLAALHLDFFIWYQVSRKDIGRSNKGNGSNLQDNNKSPAWPSLIEKCRLQMFLNRQTFGIWPQANRVQHIIENDISNNK